MPGIGLGTGNTTGSVIHPACILSFILKPRFLCRCPPLLQCIPLGEVGPTPSSMVGLTDPRVISFVSPEAGSRVGQRHTKSAFLGTFGKGLPQSMEPKGSSSLL